MCFGGVALKGGWDIEKMLGLLNLPTLPLTIVLLPDIIKHFSYIETVSYTSLWISDYLGYGEDWICRGVWMLTLILFWCNLQLPLHSIPLP